MRPTRSEPGWLTVVVTCSVAAGVAVAVANVISLALVRDAARLSDLRLIAGLRRPLDAEGVLLVPALPELFHVFFDLRTTTSLLGFTALALLLYAGTAAAVAVAAAPLIAPIVRRSARAGERWPSGLPFAVGAIGLVPIVAHRLSLKTNLGSAAIVLVSVAAAAAVWWLATRLVRSRALVRGLVAAAVAVAVGGVTLGLLGAPLARARTRVAQAAPPAGAPNVFLVSIDTLRPDHLGSYGYRRATSPTIDALAAAGARFTNAVSPTSWTLPAHVTLLTALPPEVHGVEQDQFRIGSGVTTLAQVLHQRGYATAGFVSGPYLDAGYGFARGFDHYDDYSALRISSWAVHRARTSPALVDSTTRWLAEWHEQPTRRPFFVFLHMWDVHYDFNPPPPYDTMFDPDYRGTVTTEDFETSSTVHAGMDPRDLEHVVALYDGEIRYTDDHLGRLIDVLRRLAVLDDTLVVVTSDHGEEFYEHGNKGHHKELYDESIRIPLVLRFPGRISAGIVVDAQSRLADVAPTILALTNTPVPPAFGLDPSLRAYAGRSLVPALSAGASLPPVPAFASLQPAAMTAVRHADRKLIVRPFATPQQLLFDLAADPGERSDRAVADGATATALQQELRAWSDTAALAAKRTDAAAMDEEHKAALRALGYAQ